MKRNAIPFAVLGVLLLSCAGADANILAGVYGIKGNDTGGIIPWSPANEHAALDIATERCAWFNKFALITTVHRVSGDYIVYQCRFDQPSGRHRARPLSVRD